MKKCNGIFIAMPCMGQKNEMVTTTSIFGTQKLLQHYGIRSDLKCVAASDIYALRNLFLTVWYDLTDYSHMLMVDADMGWPPDLIRDYIWFAQKKDSKALLGTIYAKRDARKVKLVGGVRDGHDELSKVVDGFLPATYVGGGLMFIPRAIVTEMIEKQNIAGGLPTYLTDPDGLSLKRFIRGFDKLEGTDLSEDVSFCERWKRCGGEIWANVRYPISHIGPFDHSLRYEYILENDHKVSTVAA